MKIWPGDIVMFSKLIQLEETKHKFPQNEAHEKSEIHKILNPVCF